MYYIQNKFWLFLLYFYRKKQLLIPFVFSSPYTLIFTNYLRSTIFID